jgi:hypothetical protein
MLWQRGKAYSQDLRERVFAAADDGQRVGQIARLLRVSVVNGGEKFPRIVWQKFPTSFWFSHGQTLSAV